MFELCLIERLSDIYIYYVKFKFFVSEFNVFMLKFALVLGPFEWCQD